MCKYINWVKNLFRLVYSRSFINFIRMIFITKKMMIILKIYNIDKIENKITNKN